MTKEPDGPWYYEQIALGFNYRMTDIQAALGLSQLARLDDFVASRHKVSDQYKILLADLPLTTPYVLPEAFSSLHLYIVQLQSEVDIKAAHKRLFDYMRSEEIGVALHYIPIYRHPYYLKYDYVQSCYPHAEDYYSRAISLPIYPKLQAGDIASIVHILKAAMNL
jgi:dTDP-4-amino-4,6-dideoxygalactose transaminase